MLQVLDLSGYSFSGKSAIYDFLTNYGNFYSHGKEFEFDLLRIRGGIHDLKNSLTSKNWSFIRASDSIKAFKQIIENISYQRNFLSRLTSIGSYYEDYFPNFCKNANNYINELILSSYQSEWPFNEFEAEGFLKSSNKFKRLLGFSNTKDVFLSRLKEDEFDEITRKFFDKLFQFIPLDKGYTHLLLNNAFEPFSPESSLNFFKSSKSIIIDRDPRDIYLSARKSPLIKGINVSKIVIGNNTNDFIRRFKIFHQNHNNYNPNILRINFEEFILAHQKTILKLEEFLNCNLITSVSKSSFDLNKSSQNIFLWKKKENLIYIKEIEQIEFNLKSFCY
tara:strand:+ start:4201 stop:5205 length:1005 start_codon:yes stop_codon:yes gene_type:complete